METTSYKDSIIESSRSLKLGGIKGCLDILLTDAVKQFLKAEIGNGMSLTGTSVNYVICNFECSIHIKTPLKAAKKLTPER